ncbi:hypothetical protein Q6283_29140, partial [Klebsiella pneumoniae]|uniref:hypothetical protein n=1 Tax=Klebsiella pneumoniae TaxID=573 RepID=UPI00272EEFBF
SRNSMVNVRSCTAPDSLNERMDLLTKSLSDKYNAMDTLGNGSNDILELVGRAYLAPGLNAVFSEHAFAGCWNRLNWRK